MHWLRLAASRFTRCQLSFASHPEDVTLQSSSTSSEAVRSASLATTTASAAEPLPPLFGGVGTLVNEFRAHDWTATSLGKEDSWPPSLRTSVQHILWSDFPNLVLWGSDLVQLYNERYQELMGEPGPSRLGRPARESALRDWLIDEPIYARVRAGETVSRENAQVLVNRNGKDEALCLTISYSPIYVGPGVVGGVLVTVFESPSQSAAHKSDREVERPLLRVNAADG